MGYKANDLLQANGIIWVEGPSNRVYLNRWLNIVAPDLVEGIHYAIAFYGGKVLAHFTCTDDPVEDLVQVLRFNRHAAVMMDRDGDSDTAKLNKNKERIAGELSEGFCWVTKGREVENYLPQRLLADYLAQRYSKSLPVRFSRNTRIEKALAAATKNEAGPKVRYADEKVAYARAFCQLMKEEDLRVLDLRDRLNELVRHIKRWNHIDVVAGGRANRTSAV